MALLETAAGSGLTGIVVDDLQFADAASVEWLQALVAAGSRLDWTLEMRPHELRAPARQWIDSLQQDAAVETVTLEPLSKPEVGVLLESLGLQGLELDAERIESLQQRTGGNPLYVLETVKVMLAGRSQYVTQRLLSGVMPNPSGAPTSCTVSMSYTFQLPTAPRMPRRRTPLHA